MTVSRTATARSSTKTRRRCSTARRSPDAPPWETKPTGPARHSSTNQPMAVLSELGEAAVVLGCDGHGRVRPGPVTYSPRAPSRACRSQAGVGVDLSRRAFCAPSRAGWLPANLGCGGLYRRSRTGAFRADLGHIRDLPAKISHANSESDTTPKLTTFTYTARCQRLRQVKGNGKPSTSATTSTVWSGSRQRKRPTARSLPNTPSTTTSTGSAAEMWAGS